MQQEGYEGYEGYEGSPIWAIVHRKGDLELLDCNGFESLSVFGQHTPGRRESLGPG
jgi:hypothetical protein